MGRTLALMLGVGLSVGIADASDDLLPVEPDNDVRLFNLTGEEPRKIGLLTYYPNVGGGYTFLEHDELAFYSLPLVPSTYKVEQTLHVQRQVKGAVARHVVRVSTVLGTIGTSAVAFGGQTIYRSEMKRIGLSLPCRDDSPIAKWTRDTPDGKFRLSVRVEDSETRLKLKSIVPVLEHAEHVR
jgi:hypothetical protein